MRAFFEVLVQHLDIPDHMPTSVGPHPMRWKKIETDLWIIKYRLGGERLLGVITSKRHPEIPPRGFRIDIRDIFGPCGEKMVHDFRTLENSGNIS